jgi:glutathione S-transferase
MYPDTPKVIPPGTEALQTAFCSHLNKVMDPIWPFLVPALPSILNPGATLEYFHRTRLELFSGRPSQDFAPKGEEARTEAWEKVEAAFDLLSGWLSKSSGPYFMGETVTFADFAFLGYLYMMKDVLGETSEEWQIILKRNDGRWAAFMKSLEQYSNTDK